MRGRRSLYVVFPAPRPKVPMPQSSVCAGVKKISRHIDKLFYCLYVLRIQYRTVLAQVLLLVAIVVNSSIFHYVQYSNIVHDTVCSLSEVHVQGASATGEETRLVILVNIPISKRYQYLSHSTPLVLVINLLYSDFP